MTDAETSPPNGRRGKVERLIAEYDLDNVGDRLEDYWLADGKEKKSLRDLAEYFNQRLLKAVMERRSGDVLEGEAENVYRLLTDDDVSSGVRVEARNSLRSDGIDIDRLEHDFVSRQAIHTYLTKHRAVQYPGEEEAGDDRIKRRAETIQRLKNRLTAVSDETLQSLRRNGDITIGDVELLVSVSARCRNCEEQWEIGDLLSNGGCACGNSSP